MINTLVVDDTILYRRVIREAVEALPGCVCAGTAADGAAALERIAQGGIDLVLLDVEMPVLNGLDTLRRIKREYPRVGVIMVSGVNKDAAATTITALQEGALEFVPKPEGADPAASREILVSQLRRHVEAFQTQRLLDEARRVPAASAPAVSPPPVADAGASPRNRPAKIELVAIGISTGGPNALHELLPRLPANLAAPVLIVQHMPPVFTASLARSLDKQSPLRVEEVVQTTPISAGGVYIAPGGKHMVLCRNAEGVLELGLNENPPENNCRPAVDVLFRSVSAHVGGSALSVVMTGMGTDGCKGARAIRQQGGVCLAQEESTCVVYGMPRAVVEAGLADEAVPLGQMHERIMAWVRNPAVAALSGKVAPSGRVVQ